DWEPFPSEPAPPGALQENPLAGLRKLTEAAHRRTRFLQPEEIGRLLEACEQSKARMYLRVAILLAVEHGASMQEVMDLTWDDIDLERGLIRFYRTKNKRRRMHDLMPGTRVALLRLREHLKAERKKRGIDLSVAGRVLVHLDGRPRSTLRDAWERTVKRAGLSDYRFHDNRHTFCSNLMLAGLDLKDVKELIGHSDIRMTDRYSHLSPARKKQAHTRLAAHYGDAVAVAEAEEEAGTT
ncbi:MAG: site-specific integrase, partial [Desulfocurvibacter africanus]